jgi:hypothetical protein
MDFFEPKSPLDNNGEAEMNAAPLGAEYPLYTDADFDDEPTEPLDPDTLEAAQAAQRIDPVIAGIIGEDEYGYEAVMRRFWENLG